MKKILRLLVTGLLLITIVSAADAQRGMRRWADSSDVKRPGREMRQAPPVKEFQDSLRKGFQPGYRFGYGYGPMIPGGRGLWAIPPHGSPYGFGPRYFYNPGFIPGPYIYRHYGRNNIRPLPPGLAPGRKQAPYIYNIPDLTEKQKKEIESLREKFNKDLDKLREENLKKMDELRKSHQEKIRNLLTPDQKKWFDERIEYMQKFRRF